MKKALVALAMVVALSSCGVVGSVSFQGPKTGWGYTIEHNENGYSVKVDPTK